ncbi:MAG: nucleotidyltransferase domain-containing protein [Phycisphaeraceae bacterium]|nr:nucleotidyltransferase domain-containing protein [Phycisphaeraceae bacterium]
MSGAHLYGFASPDSDYDLRGAHVLPAKELLGLHQPRETFDILDRDLPIEMDIVTHDVRKFFSMLLRNNGYVLEQIFSPIVLYAAPEFSELKEIAATCITRNCRHHFRSFAKHQWKSVAGSSAGTVKGLLYTYRPLLAGIHLMREHRVESNLRVLNESFGLPFIDDLIAQKIGGEEKQLLGSLDMQFHEQEFERLLGELESASESSGLPEHAQGRDALNDLLLRLRLATLQS